MVSGGLGVGGWLGLAWQRSARSGCSGSCEVAACFTKSSSGHLNENQCGRVLVCMDILKLHSHVCMHVFLLGSHLYIHINAVILTADSFLLGWGGVPYQVGQAGS